MRLKQWSCLLISLVLCTAIVSSAKSSDSKIESPELSYREFSQLINSMSEDSSQPSSHFTADNFITNEDSYLRIFPKLLSYADVGKGVYIGVGPDQNFSYIAQLRPQIVFIIDIRRQNMLQILLTKALFEEAETRKEFLELLFGRSGKSFDEVLDATGSIKQQPFEKKIIKNAIEQIEKKYQIDLSKNDKEVLHRIHRTFCQEAGDIRYMLSAINYRAVIRT